jgi:hypothetical protein
MMRNMRALLFPHSFVPEEDIKKALSVFHEVTVFQPWFMTRSLSVATELPELVHVLTPPNHLRPPENFKSLLAEYREWIRNNHDNGSAAFVTFAGVGEEAEPASWEIRSMIRRRGQAGEGAEKTISFKWHLILHLATETEEEQREAEKIWKSLGKLGSPLKGSMEEEELPGLLSDLPGLDREAIFREERLAQILEAWAGLFGDKMAGERPLITFNPQIMEYIIHWWEEFTPPGKGSRSSRLELTVPDLSALSRGEFLEKRKAFFEDKGLLKAVDEFCRDPENVSKLKKPDVYGLLPSGQGSLRLTLAYLLPLRERSIPKRYEFMNHFSGKIIGFIEETRADER